MTALAAGCSSGTATTQGVPAQTTAAMRSLRAAADQLALVNSIATSFVVMSTQARADQETGSVQLQFKPARLVVADFKLTAPGRQPAKLTDILTDKAAYFNDPAFARFTKRAWVKIDLSQVSKRSGLAFAAIFQNLESANLIDQARLFGASTDVHAVGTATVNGVATTEYAGTYTAQAALARLSPAQHRLFAPLLMQMGKTPARFQVWIDGQHLIRKAELTETANNHTTTTTFVVTAVNQPVTVKLPAAGQIAKLPSLP